MPNNKLVLHGMSEFRQALRDLPSDLADEGQGIVIGTVNEAKSEIVNAYPEVSGQLKRGVTVTTETSSFGTSAVLKSGARHSHLYEYGTQVRHTDIGANRGAMPAKPTFIPVVMRKRKAMYEALKALLRRAGLTVSGDAG